MSLEDNKLDAIRKYIDEKIIWVNTLAMKDPHAIELGHAINGHVARIVLDIREILEDGETIEVGSVDGSQTYEIPAVDMAIIMARNYHKAGLLCDRNFAGPSWFCSRDKDHEGPCALWPIAG